MKTDIENLILKHFLTKGEKVPGIVYRVNSNFHKTEAKLVNTFYKKISLQPPHQKDKNSPINLGK